jgi:hypothetical protein
MDFLNNDPARIFTHLHARITQEEDGFRLSIRMHNRLKEAWGIETASSIEVASTMIGQLAQRFSIAQNCISIKIVMDNFKESTLH